MEVRASDIRVSERVCMSSITIDGYTTVYNELTDEVMSIISPSSFFIGYPNGLLLCSTSDINIILTSLD